MEPALLRELVDLARLHASGGNLQPLRYAIVSKQPLVKEMFDCFGWAMYLPDFVISENQRPQAYILLLSDAKARRECPFDAGAAATTIMTVRRATTNAALCIRQSARHRRRTLITRKLRHRPRSPITLRRHRRQEGRINASVAWRSRRRR